MKSLKFLGIQPKSKVAVFAHFSFFLVKTHHFAFSRNIEIIVDYPKYPRFDFNQGQRSCLPSTFQFFRQRVKVYREKKRNFELTWVRSKTDRHWSKWTVQMIESRRSHFNRLKVDDTQVKKYTAKRVESGPSSTSSPSAFYP